jgi:Spy/CpxP family protein refolding chaperone
MLRDLRRLAFSLALAAAFAAPAHAQRGQGRGMGMMGGGGGMAVLSNPAGEKELSLTDEQKEKIADIRQNMMSDMRDKMQSIGQDASPQERMQKMQEVMRELNSGLDKDVKEVLKPEQYTRYQEIKLQSMGLDAFSDPEVAKKLELTDEQKEKLETLTNETRQETMETMQAARDSGDFQGAMGKVREIRDKALDDAKALLTEAQKETWSKLTGKPFKLEPMGPGGPRRQID